MKSFIIKSTILIITINLTYVLFEFIVFPSQIKNLNAFQKKPIIRIAWPLTYKTKDNFIPKKNYQVIIGGSDAMGFGDWSIKEKDYYGAGNALYSNCNKENLIFAKESSGTFEYLYSAPPLYKNYLNKIESTIKDPENIFIFYYPSNDVFDDRKIVEDKLGKNNYLNNLSVNDRKELYKVIQQETTLYKNTKSPLNTWIFLHYLKEKLFGKEDRVSLQQHKRSKNKNFIGKNNYLADELQAPPVEANNNEMIDHFLILEDGLIQLKELYPKSVIHLIHLTSPALFYNWTNNKVSIQSYKYKSQPVSVTKKEMSSMHYKIKDKVSNISTNLEINYVDMTQYLREKVKNKIIHGPKDWKHLNKLGYELLAKKMCEIIRS